MVNMVIIGANVGRSDPSAAWVQIRKNGWRGLFVEPLPQSFEKLKQYYSDVEGNYFEQAAIMPDVPENEGLKGYVTFYYNLDLTTSASTISNPRNNLNETTVRALTLTRLLEKYNLIDVEFDLLQLDIEGQDISVLKSTDFTHILPKYIRVETIHNPQNQIDDLSTHLKKWGYAVLSPDPFWKEYAANHPAPEKEHYNTVYIKKEEG